MGLEAKDTARLLVRRAERARAQQEREADALRERVRESLASVDWRGHGIRAWVIGSLVWGGFGPRSDVDLVVSDASSEELTRMEALVAAATGRPVDVLVYEDLPEAFRARIDAEGVPLHGA